MDRSVAVTDFKKPMLTVKAAFTPSPSAPQSADHPMLSTNASVQQSLLQWLLDRDFRAVFAVGISADLLFMNSAARRLAHYGHTVEIAQRKLKFCDRRSQDEFILKLGRIQKLGCILLRPKGASVCVHMDLVEDVGRSEQLVVCRFESMPGNVPDCEFLKSVLRLSPAEAQVALAIFNGKSLVEIAAVRHASLNTVKSQLQRIFEKCGVRSQVALVRKICESSAEVVRGESAFPMPPHRGPQDESFALWT